MKILTSRQQLSALTDNLKQQQQSIGFVPTMGALHEGHMSLIDTARRQSDIVVCSIFVNPTQFGDPADLEKYPRTEAEDIRKLKEANCDILFLPSVDEMYGANETWHLDIGYLENILEGEFRPGHYQGVTQIVSKLFSIVKPDKAFFGQKDFQQVLVIKRMLDILHMPVDLVMCPIKREADGLAMSSRNVRLSAKERVQALAISKTLFHLREQASHKTIQELKQEAEYLLKNSEGIDLDYIELYDAEKLTPAIEGKTKDMIALVAATVGSTRLIDNMLLQ